MLWLLADDGVCVVCVVVVCDSECGGVCVV